LPDTILPPVPTLVADYLEIGTVIGVARKHGGHSKKIRDILVASGVTIRPRGRPVNVPDRAPRRRPSALPAPRPAHTDFRLSACLAVEYRILGSIERVAARRGVSVEVIRSRLAASGIDLCPGWDTARS
jgi:hypothetical protein